MKSKVIKQSFDAGAATEVLNSRERLMKARDPSSNKHRNTDHLSSIWNNPELDDAGENGIILVKVSLR